ncbi:MAG: prolyl oligopeptidase family serine peptidase [Phycisphaeraceae bacterium]|nr:prolyl oligopeptidase family serine peptidase [Phycisphaeraceae bacterium]
MTTRKHQLSIGVLLVLMPVLACAQSKTFTATDTLDLDLAPRDLAWEPAPEGFAVVCSPGNGVYSAVVQFDSPRPSGVATLDRVTMWWYAARDEQGQPIDGPAVLVVHTLHPDMPFAQQIAATLASKGIHAFLIHLPGYGDRVDESGLDPGSTALLHAEQGIADVRRARDAIVVLPHIETATIVIQGTSLGGFVAATAAGMDGAFELVFLAFCGGDVMTVLTEGKFDAEWQHQRLLRAGYDDQQMREKLSPVDPLRLADRLDPERTYLYSAKADQVIPAGCTAALSDAIGLDQEHHLWYDCDHYTAALFLPAVIEHVCQQIRITQFE